MHLEANQVGNATLAVSVVQKPVNTDGIDFITFSLFFIIEFTCRLLGMDLRCNCWRLSIVVPFL